MPQLDVLVFIDQLFYLCLMVIPLFGFVVYIFFPTCLFFALKQLYQDCYYKQMLLLGRVFCAGTEDIIVFTDFVDPDFTILF